MIPTRSGWAEVSFPVEEVSQAIANRLVLHPTWRLGGNSLLPRLHKQFSTLLGPVYSRGRNPTLNLGNRQIRRLQLLIVMFRHFVLR